MNLNEYADTIHKDAQLKGHWDDDKPFPTVIALIMSELGEALQADRKYEGDERVAEEMADVLIRTLDWCGKNKLDIDKIVMNKIEYNRTRPHKHNCKY